MDNPQETDNLNIKCNTQSIKCLSNIKWLAGFFDTEGSIAFTTEPSINIINTCSRMSFFIKDILNSIRINASINDSEKPSKSSKKPRWNITLKDKDQIKLFIKHLRPFIKTKILQLDLVDEWYNTNDEKIKDKIKFVNEFKDKIYLNQVEKKYPDIPVLNDEDGIITYGTFLDLDYLAGLLDGDGNIKLDCQIKRREVKYIPQVLFINTNKVTVNNYCSILKNINVGHKINFRRSGKITKRRRWDITVLGIKRCCNFLEQVKDRLEIRREQANLLLQYCKHRLMTPIKEDNLGFDCKKSLENMQKGFYI